MERKEEVRKSGEYGEVRREDGEERGEEERGRKETEGVVRLGGGEGQVAAPPSTVWPPLQPSARHLSHVEQAVSLGPAGR